jgi:parallel beta-helix repeat protein
MLKNSLFNFLLSLIFFLLLLNIGLPPARGGENSIITVPDDVSSINLAIAAVPEGGTVIVRRGVYTEEVYVSKPITLLGENGARMLAPIKVLDVKNVTLKGMSIKIIPAGTATGIVLLNASKALLENLEIVGTGIWIVNSTEVTVRNCTFTENPGPAIQVRGASSNGILIESCLFNKTYTALSVRQGANITFRFNTVYGESFSIKLFSGCSNTTIYMNNIFKGEAEDNGLNNKWHNETLKLGNLWGEPKPEGDRNGDGIIDEPKNIGGTAQSVDKYPLTKPFTEYMNNKNQPIGISTTIITATAVVAVIIFTALYRKRHGKVEQK